MSSDRGLAEAASLSRPLAILAEGDSWFDYPWILGTRGSVIDHLSTLIDTPILNLAHHGDEVRRMMGLEQREEIEKRLREGPGRGRQFDVMLFSGGGNDIVGDPLCLWLRPYEPSMSASDVLEPKRVSALLDMVEAGYRDLITLRDAVSKSTWLFFHTYDFALPTGTRVCGQGPWLKPGLDFRKVPREIQPGVIRELLKLFAERLRVLADTSQNCRLIDLQGVVGDDGWSNELHANADGLARVARVFATALSKQFPSQVSEQDGPPGGRRPAAAQGRRPVPAGAPARRGRAKTTKPRGSK